MSPPSLPRHVPLNDHPSVIAWRARRPRGAAEPLPFNAVQALALAAGADDASAVSVDHPDLADERPHILAAMPDVRSLVSFVVRTHPDSIRSPKRTLANLEFHRAGDQADEVAHRIAVALAEHGHRAMNPPMAFPMEMAEFPGRTWVVSHKRVAEAAELGKMGLHRSVIHPQFGSFVLLGTVFTSAEIIGRPAPLDFNPCVTCKLCVAACPVGAIEPDGQFRFSACYDHNYREFMTGFSDFVEEVVESKNRADFRDRVPLNEAVATWQSLANKPSYKAAYCIAVCPAGEELLGGFVDRRADHLRDVLKPLTERTETVYVVAGSDAEVHVKRRFPHKRVRTITSGLRPTTAQGLFDAMPLTFQRGPALGWKARFHFELTGEEAVRATVIIDNGTLEVEAGVLSGQPDVHIRTDARLWLDIVNKRRSPIAAVLTRRLKITGNRSLLDRFAGCFPR